MDYSIIITTKQEPKTVGPLVKAIQKDLENASVQAEVLLVCPDLQTKNAAKNHDEQNIVKWIKDQGKGKPAALNLAFKKAQGEVLVLTDGDVAWNTGSFQYLIDQFEQGVGLVSGHPVPLNSRTTCLGYWSHFLTTAADYYRSHKNIAGEYFDGSGYLMAVKKKFVKKMPENILVDDAYLSHQVWSQGKKIKYTKRALVKVVFPKNLNDWVKQKSRTLSGYLQLRQMGIVKKENKTRTFGQEIKGLRFISHPQNIREYYYLFLLFLVRLYVWLVVLFKRRVLKQKYSGNWTRIESTKG